MKTLNKLGLLGVFATACALNPINTQALSPEALVPDANGVVTLTEDVTLDSTLVLKADSNIKTIDLNGHTLTRGTRYGYLINSSTDLTIKNGNIVCGKEQDVIDGIKTEKSSSSCVRNNKSLAVEGTKIDAYWTALKAEEGTTLSVKNSTLTSESGTAGTILNYGDATIESSSIKAAPIAHGAAIYTMSYYGDKAYGANVVVSDSTIEGYWPVIIGKYDDKSESDALATNVSFVGDNKIVSNYGFVRKDTGREDSTLTIDGKVSAPIEALEYLEEGTTLTVNEDITGEVTVVSGITLVIPDGIAVTETGKINFEEGAIIENRSGKDIEVYTELNGEEKMLVVPNMSGIGKEEDDGEIQVPVEPENPVTPEKPDEEPVKNPQTFDGVTVYAALAVLSVAGLGLVLKKHLN